ncbi:MULTISPECIES: VOC family protein [Basfia]|uniref:YecM protein n=2 Tax=Basfia TaxID=697331 RepID=Q65SX5_MANSM|nr:MULTISPECIES: VOC family protein [Basfia]AAU37935.1 unknown [[Mannheimia] succiniciproducens MBEL55E]SCX77763.1 hypothetical protein SAMN02910354_00329 [Basfia succiniciproducens]
MQKFNQIHSLFEHLPANYGEFSDFEQKIATLAQEMKVDLSLYEIDHLSIRVNTEDKAKSWLTTLLNYGKILSNNLVNGRAIYLIELEQPLLFMGQRVFIIELPFPKNKHYPVESWEHIEFVIPFLPNESSIEWVERVQQQFLWNQSGNLTIKVDEPKVDGEQLPNPSIAVSFADKSQNHVCIKVHPFNIKNIIKVS